MSEFYFDIYDYDLSGVPGIDADGDDRAVKRREQKAMSGRKHKACCDYSDRKTVHYPFRAPQKAMFEAIAAALRSLPGELTCNTVYDATTAWALHFERGQETDYELVTHWEWCGPYVGGNAFNRWAGDGMPTHLFWWDGKRLRKIPRKEAGGGGREPAAKAAV